jgi:hypothetical protein
MIPSVGLLTDQPMPDSLTISGHSWSNSAGGYPLAYANDYAVVRLIHARNVGNRDCSSSLPLQSRAQWRYRFVIHLHGHLKETKTVHDLRCIIIKGIESWFITGDTNDPSSETVAQIGWFQVLQGYIPEEDLSKKPSIEAEGEKARRTIQAMMKELIEFF